MSVGDVVQAAIDHGMRVEAVQVSDEPFLDIGTGEDLVSAVRRAVGDQRTDFRGQKT